MSTNPHWHEARRVLHEALNLPPADREAFLRGACAGAPDLLAEVQSLLAWVEDSDDFLETPIVRVADYESSPDDADRRIGQTLGPWRIVGIIGRGGMGVVYRAERADAAFRRVVAIKIVGRSGHAADIIDRFHRERETLAALDHPNIARVIDGGSTEDGQPYIVMEHVAGVRVDTYCDDNRLTIDERLALFRSICSAVQYAHQALVVHRDLKPDNILVTGDGQAKLLDFGIARVLSDDGPQPAHDGVMAATWLMTPDYASPEQIAGGVVTTATDVYSLGVLLHLLLTGRSPYQLRASTQSELRHELNAATLMLPSACALAGGAEATERAARRATTPRGLSRRLAGDLDAIVMRALARDLPARYRSVEQLVDELDRHATHHPVAARGQYWPYLARTFARRHRVALTVVTLLGLLIAAGAAAVLWQAALAAEARARAERRFNDVRRLANVFMFDVHDAIVNVPGTTRARELMVRTASEYLEELAGEVSDDVGLQRELASAFVKVGDARGHPTSANIGDTAGARASYERAIALTSAILDDAPDDLESQRTRALAHRRLGDVLAWSGDVAAAIAHARTSRARFVAIAANADATADDRLQAAVAELKLGDLLGNPMLPNLGQRAEATAQFQQTLTALRTLAASAPSDAQVQRYLGIVLERLGTMYETAADWTAAEQAYQESFVIRAQLAGGAPLHTDMQRDLAIAHEKLGNVHLAAGDAGAAAADYRGALSQFERLAHADPSNVIAARSVAISREKLAGVLVALERRPEAVAQLRTAVATLTRLADRDPDSAQARCDRGRMTTVLGDTLAGDSQRAAACQAWRTGYEALVALSATEVNCVNQAELARLSAQAIQCR